MLFVKELLTHVQGKICFNFQCLYNRALINEILLWYICYLHFTFIIFNFFIITVELACAAQMLLVQQLQTPALSKILIKYELGIVSNESNLTKICDLHYNCIVIFTFFYHYSGDCMCGTNAACSGANGVCTWVIDLHSVSSIKRL